jgi:MoaA/NifB/PqqE/SkfB family radical SAM enzyme
MCDIWKKESGPELKPRDYLRLPSSLREINLTGGEPLLREDLAQVIHSMQKACPGVRVVLSTNGLLPERLDGLLAETEDVTVRVSLDGLGEVHDTIRGTPGAYDRAMASIEAARRRGVTDLGVCATMSRHNAGSLNEIQRMARERGLHFTCTVAHSSDFFFGDQSEEAPDPRVAERDIKTIRARLYDSPRPRDWFKGYFVSGLLDVLRNRPRPVDCRAGRDFFYLDPEGRVYPCHLWNQSMGNILEQSFEEMATANPDLLGRVQACNRRCWMTCTVAPEMRRRLPVYAAKVGWAKLAHHFGSVFKSG